MESPTVTWLTSAKPKIWKLSVGKAILAFAGTRASQSQLLRRLNVGLESWLRG